MRVSLIVSSNCEEQHSQVVLNSCYVTYVAGTFEMKTCGGILNQRSIEVVVSRFLRRPQSQREAKAIVKCALKSVIAPLLNECVGFL